jgi:hypothetical protein
VLDHVADAVRAAQLRSRLRQLRPIDRDVEAVILGQRAPQFTEQERVPASQLPDLDSQRRDVGGSGSTGRPAHELHHILIPKAREPDANHAVGALQVGERFGELGPQLWLAIAEGHHQQQPGLAASNRQVPHQV